MSKEECRICGYVKNCYQCCSCSLKGCPTCIEFHKDACSVLKKDKIHLCSDHNEFVNSYCFTCFHLVCKNCSKDMHINHNFVSIPQAVHNIRSEILTSVNDLEKRKTQEESAMSQFCRRKNDYEQKLPALIDAAEKELHKGITVKKDQLVKQIIALNEKNLSDVKEIVPELDAAIDNLKSVQDKKFPILFLSRWSNPMLVIGKHESILRNRESADDINMDNNADIERIFRNSFVTLHAANMLNEENQTTIMCMENQRKQLQDSIKDKDKLIQTLLLQKDELQSRLSSIAGEKLTKGNPGITDLSDPNRPMKISERYGELYDNEWTDAMETVELIKPHFPDLEKSELDEIIVRHLYRTLMFCYQECKNISLKQTQTIRQTIAESFNLTIDSENTEPNLPGWKEISFYRKHHGDDFATSLITKCTSQKLCENILENWDYSYKSEMFMQELLKTPFFEKCVHLCWYMAIQEPMMYLDDKLQVDTKYNKTEYKEYVQSGDKIRYIVWPALYLHEKGPLLYKGVVQAYF